MSKLALSLCFALSACGSVEHFDDANNGPIDGPAAPDAEATTGTANVTTFALFTSTPDQPLAGIDVVVVGADGTQRDLQMSDTSGHATVNVHTGDSVTAIYRDISRDTMVTFDGVKPNDNLVYGLGGAGGGGGTATGSANVSISDIGASYYTVYSACDGLTLDANIPSATLQFYDDCPATAPLVYRAYDASGNIIDWARVSSVNTTQNTTIAAPAWQNTIGFTISGGGIPAEVTQLTASVQDLLGGTGNYAVSVGYNGAPTGGAFSTTLPFINGPANGFSTQVSYFRDNLHGQEIDWGTLPQNAVAFSIQNPSLLPWLGQLTFDQTSRTVTLAEDGASTGFESTILDVQYSRVLADAGNQSFEWLVIAGPSTSTFTLPALPGADATLGPLPSDASNFLEGLIIDYPNATTYDQVRAMPLGQIIPFTAPVAGTRAGVTTSNQGLREAHHSLLSRTPATEVHR